MEESVTLADFLEYYKKSMGLEPVDVRTYSPLVLAYIGDAVYELMIRSKVINHGSMQVNKMHKHSAALVKASAQAQLIKALQEELTEEELAAYKRGSNPKIKVQITKSGSTTYTYDLNNSGVYEVFPLSEGSGSYQVKVFENVSGNQYSQAFSQDVSANITNEFGPFLYPNQYVNFNAASAAVQTGAAVCAGSADQVAVVADIYNYVITNITYDTAKAASVQSGYLPNVDVVLAQKKGICFDYAALMTAMLRSQDIPTKLVVGYTGNLYHAWINVYLDGQGWVDNVIYFDGHDWKLMDPTFASSGNQSEEIMKYIGNGSNYQGKYSY